MKDVFMLIYFLFAYAIGNLINLYVNEGEHVEKLFAGHIKKEFKCSKKHENMLEEPNDQLQT